MRQSMAARNRATLAVKPQPRPTGSRATTPAKRRKGYAEKVLMPDGRRVYPWMTAEGYAIAANGRICY